MSLPASGAAAPGVPLAELLADAPPPDASWGRMAASLVVRSERRVLAVDDDPTGTQTVRDVPLVTSWCEDDLEWLLRQPSALSVVVTNSRSMPAETAAATARELAQRIACVAKRGGLEISVLSRSDSTLRGHFPIETDQLAAGWREQTGEVFDGMILCPAFIEAGRVTVDDVHWVVRDGNATPVSATEFAGDKTFGYGSSNLRAWIAEKSSNRWAADEVLSISLADIRSGGPDRVVEKLEVLQGGRPAVVNAADNADLDVVALAIVQAELRGRRFLCRCGPSFLRARAGLPAPATLSAAEVRRTERAADAHGLVVVGSHVGLTNLQLERALLLGGFEQVEVDVAALLDGARRGEELARAVAAVADRLRRRDVVLSTSREVSRGPTAEASLELSAAVADGVVSVVQGAYRRAGRLRYLVTKGGITSSTVVSGAIGLRRGWVVGQVLPGMVSLWMPAETGARDGPAPRLTFPLVIFAGNVGGPDALADVIRALRG